MHSKDVSKEVLNEMSQETIDEQILRQKAIESMKKKSRIKRFQE